MVSLSFPPIVTSWKVLYGLPCWPWYFLVSTHQLCLTQTYIYYFSSSQEIVFFSDSFFFLVFCFRCHNWGSISNSSFHHAKVRSLSLGCWTRFPWLSCVVFASFGYPVTKIKHSYSQIMVILWQNTYHYSERHGRN